MFEKSIGRGQHKGSDHKAVQHRISGFADLYIHLFFHTARFLKPGARMGIITSNAWLDVNYGHEIQKFFLKHFKIIAIFESRCEPWFTEASVNTIVTIVERCDNGAERDNHLAKFVKVKKPLGELIPGDPVVDAVPRLRRLRDLSACVEHTGRRYAKTHPLGIETEEDEETRIRLVRQSELGAGVRGALAVRKWGYLLRAPEVMLKLRVDAAANFVVLGELADMKFGSKTGINAFYYLTPEQAQQYGIEPEYLLKVMRATDDASHSIVVTSAALPRNVFVCRRTKQELQNLGHTGAVRYIEWGEQQKFTSGNLAGMTWPHGVEVKNRKPGWYALPTYRGYSARVFWQKAYHDIYLQRFSEVDLIPDQRLYFLDPSKGVEAELLSAVLNSFVVALALESIAPVTAGEGVCEVRLEDARDSLLVPNLYKMTKAQRTTILTAFQPLKKRSIMRVFDEVKQKDRQVFDSAVLKAIGLNPKKHLKPIYEGLCELVRERIELGRLRGRARKVKSRGTRAEKQVADDVLDELLPDGPKRFPSEFFSAIAAEGKKAFVELPEDGLIFDHSPLFTGVHTKDNSYSRSVKTPAEGKFLLYAQQSGHRTAELPEKVVEINRTVANYESYVRELRKQLYEAYYRRTLDTKTAARLTQAAFERFRLPNVEA